jgi:hypothetical protein
MSTLESVVIQGQRYIPLFEDGEIVSIKRYNCKYGMWVTLKFTGSDVTAESELLEMLKREYIQQNTRGGS